MEEQKQPIEVTQDQALTIQEFDAQITLTEIQLARLQQARYQYLIEQDLINPEEIDKPLEKARDYAE